MTKNTNWPWPLCRGNECCDTDCTSQENQSLREQLAAVEHDRDNLLNQVVMLREAIDRQPYTMDKQVCEALAATSDLDRYILCERESVAALERQRDTFASHGHRLALELECLLMDTKDLPTVSRWWDTGMSALTNWQNLFPYDGPRIGE